MQEFLKVRDGRLIFKGEPLQLTGINLGGWLMMEGYFLYAPNTGVQVFKNRFKDQLGDAALEEFEHSFHDTFIQENDFERIAQWGLNCVRLPFHYNLIEKSPVTFDEEGLRYLEQAVDWGEKFGIGVILDLHAAPGCQSRDWHCDSMGKAELWEGEVYQERTIALWEYVADRFKGRTAVAGYDLLNEPVLDSPEVLNRFYQKLIKRLRAVDDNHVFFVEGRNWSTDIACLDDFQDANVCLSLHMYDPLDFTFNFVPGLSYPLKQGVSEFGKETLRKIAVRHQQTSQRVRRPIFVGEFGVNVRDGFYGENQWLDDILDVFQEFDFSWTYWTYKAVKNSVFPDGVQSYMGNPPWVRREGPTFGWENYADLWPDRKNEIIRSWKTAHFTVHEPLLKILKKFAGRRFV